MREGAAQHHFYLEPFVRDDHLVRLLTGEPGTGIGALVDTSERHTVMTVTRNKEWWGDQAAEDRDAGLRQWRKAVERSFDWVD